MVRHNGIEIDRRRHIIRHAGNLIFVSGRTRFRLLSTMILAGPSSAEQLFDLLYADRADGGPELGTKHVNVLLSQMRDYVRRVGLEIIVGRNGTSVNQYALVSIGFLYNGWRVYGHDARAAKLRVARNAYWEKRKCSA